VKEHMSGLTIVGAVLAIMTAAVVKLLWWGISLAFLIWVADRTLQMLGYLP